MDLGIPKLETQAINDQNIVMMPHVGILDQVVFKKVMINFAKVRYKSLFLPSLRQYTYVYGSQLYPSRCTLMSPRHHMLLPPLCVL